MHKDFQTANLFFFFFLSLQNAFPIAGKIKANSGNASICIVSEL